MKAPYYILIFSLLAGLAACSKKATEYRSFQNGKEKIYPGVVSNLSCAPGKNRCLFSWSPNADPSVTRYLVTWNLGADSLWIKSKSNNPDDTVSVFIPGLAEGSYNFTLFSVDDAGNISVPSQLWDQTVFGVQYEKSLVNRHIETSYFDGVNTLTINWRAPDSVHLGTILTYTDLSGKQKSVNVQTDETVTRLEDYNAGKVVSYLSAYKPRSNAVDTFFVSKSDTLKL